MGCIVDLLAFVWSFILGSLRIILFFGCILFFVIQLSWTSLLFYSLDKGELPAFASVDNWDFLHAFALLFVALIGCYGSFYKHHGAIRFFSFANALSVILTIFGLLIAYKKGEPGQLIERFADTMRDHMSSYDWSHHSGKIEMEAATRKWDSLQSLGCCGLNSAKDWDKYRPSYVDDDKYPASCCPHSPISNDHDFCEKPDKIFELGCVDEIKMLTTFEATIIIVLVMFQTLLCVMAYVIGCCDPDDGHLEDIDASNRRLTSNSTVPPEYRRYDGSIYIRNPSTGYFQQGNVPQGKEHITSLYPNLHDQRMPQGRSPPPRYGST